MALEALSITLPNPADIADQGPAVGLEILELNSARKWQAPLRRIGHLHQMTTHTATHEAAQTLAKRIQRHEEVTNQDQARVARQLLGWW